LSEGLSTGEVCRLLGLEANATCGFVRVSFVSGRELGAGALGAPLEAARPLGSALYFLVTGDAPVRLHRIRNDQLYHYYLGDPIEVFLLQEDGTAGRVVVGPDLRAGQQLQLPIPGGTFHTARLVDGGSWFLGASTEWPGVIPADVELGDLEALAASHPAVAAEIRAIAAAVRPQKP
jgi:predicted cupin superfamily sugar epimerase